MECGVPNPLAKDRIEGRYLGLVRDALIEAGAPDAQLRLQIDAAEPPAPWQVEWPAAQSLALLRAQVSDLVWHTAFDGVRAVDDDGATLTLARRGRTPGSTATTWSPMVRCPRDPGNQLVQFGPNVVPTCPFAHRGRVPVETASGMPSTDYGRADSRALLRGQLDPTRDQGIGAAYVAARASPAWWRRAPGRAPGRRRWVGRSPIPRW